MTAWETPPVWTWLARHLPCILVDEAAITMGPLEPAEGPAADGADETAERCDFAVWASCRCCGGCQRLTIPWIPTTTNVDAKVEELKALAVAAWPAMLPPGAVSDATLDIWCSRSQVAWLSALEWTAYAHWSPSAGIH